MKTKRETEMTTIANAHANSYLEGSRVRGARVEAICHVSESESHREVILVDLTKFAAESEDDIFSGIFCALRDSGCYPKATFDWKSIEYGQFVGYCGNLTDNGSLIFAT